MAVDDGGAIKTWGRAADSPTTTSDASAASGESAATSQLALDVVAAANAAFELPDVPTTFAQHEQRRPPLRNGGVRRAASDAAIHQQRVLGGTARSGVAERQGRRPTMEDADVIIDDVLAAFPALGSTLGVQRASFYGVFDGHAGARAAAYVARHLVRTLSFSFQARRKMTCRCLFQLATLVDELTRDGGAKSDEARENAMARAFRDCDVELLRLSVVEEWDDGSTGVCALVLDDRVYVANWSVLVVVSCVASSTSFVFDVSLANIKRRRRVLGWPATECADC